MSFKCPRPIHGTSGSSRMLSSHQFPIQSIFMATTSRSSDQVLVISHGARTSPHKPIHHDEMLRQCLAHLAGIQYAVCGETGRDSAEHWLVGCDGGGLCFLERILGRWLGAWSED